MGISKNGRRVVGDLLVVEGFVRKGHPTRLGITATKRYGKAHERNRFKRLVRESFRSVKEQLPWGLQINVRPRTGAKTAELKALCAEFKQLANQSSHPKRASARQPKAAKPQ